MGRVYTEEDGEDGCQYIFVRYITKNGNSACSVGIVAVSDCCIVKKDYFL